MARPYDRPATVVAIVNALVVFLLPIALVGTLAALGSDSSNSSTAVRARGPNYLQHRLTLLVAYATGVAPFAMGAAWRTFVHARNWLEHGRPGWWGVLEAGTLGFLAAVLILLPGIVTRPTEAPPYVIAYGGLSLLVGLAIGLILWATATITLRLITRTGLVRPPP